MKHIEVMATADFGRLADDADRCADLDLATPAARQALRETACALRELLSRLPRKQSEPPTEEQAAAHIMWQVGWTDSVCSTIVCANVEGPGRDYDPEPWEMRDRPDVWDWWCAPVMEPIDLRVRNEG